MHLRVQLPKLVLNEIPEPTHCPLPDRAQPMRTCRGRHFKLHQRFCLKPLRDTEYLEALAHRYRCLTCGRTFRVYSRGVSHDQQSDRLKALSVLLYSLSLSYQGVADVFTALQIPLGVTAIYENVQAAGHHVQRLQQRRVRELKGHVPVLGVDFTHVKCLGQDRIVAVATALLTGEVVTIDLLPAASALRIEQWLAALTDWLGVEVLVTDDADGLKTVADHLGLQHQICRAHVNRNLHDLVAALGTRALEHPDKIPWEVADATVEKFLEDVMEVEWIIQSLPHDGQTQLERILSRYQKAPPPAQGHKATMWYRLRRLVLDWFENWARLTLYQKWRSIQNEKLDGTNNGSERVIGQGIKERYRSMRGYKRNASILNVSRLVTWLWTHPDCDLTPIVAQ